MLGRALDHSSGKHRWHTNALSGISADCSQLAPLSRPVRFRKYVRPQLALRNNHSIALPASHVF